MTKIISMALVLGINGSVLFAQEAEPLPLLYGRSTIWYSVPIQPPSTCECFKRKALPKKESILSLDISVSPFWDTVKEDRIQNRTVRFGGTATPLRDTVRYRGWPVPRINFSSQNLRATVEGGIMKTLKASPSRTMGQVRGGIDKSLWHVLVGADGFLGQEKVPLAIKGLNFDADFRRRSAGGQGWLGVKVGNFNRSFIAGRYGKGYARTEGSMQFIIPNIGGLDWFPIYLEEFRTAPFSVEGKAKAKRISQSVRFDRVEYERVIPSPDPLRFGENRLEDMWLRTETEIVPLPHVGIVVIWTKDFRDQNRLMFINDYSSVRVLLRLAF